MAEKIYRGLLESLCGCFESPLCLQPIAEIDNAIDVVRTRIHRPLHQIDGLVDASDLQTDDAEVMQCIGLIGLLIEQAPINLFRFLQFATAVVVNGAFERSLLVSR